MNDRTFHWDPGDHRFRHIYFEITCTAVVLKVSDPWFLLETVWSTSGSHSYLSIKWFDAHHPSPMRLVAVAT